MTSLIRRIHKAVTGHAYLTVQVKRPDQTWREDCLRCVHDRSARGVGGGGW